MGENQYTTKKAINLIKDVGERTWRRQSQQRVLSHLPYSIRVISGELYCCTAGGVAVYDRKLQPIRAIRKGTMGIIHDVAQYPDQYLIVACKKGLFKITQRGDKLNDIAEGSFTCVQMNDDVIYAASSDGSIRAYTLDEKGEFQLALSFKPDCAAIDHWPTIVLKPDRIITSCDYEHKLRVFLLDGVPFHFYEENESKNRMNDDPRVCQIDKKSSVLVVNQSNHRLQVVDEHGHWQLIRLHKPVQNPCTAVYFDNKLFVLSFGPYLLSVFARE